MHFNPFPIDSKDNILNHTEKVAALLWSHILQVGNSFYLVTEFEFYIRSKDESHLVFKDEYTYGNVMQLSLGKLYLHASGIDISWGNKELYVGILIRGIAKIKNIRKVQIEIPETGDYNLEKIINGPHKVATELFSNFKFGGQNSLQFIPSIFPKGTNHAFLHTSKTQRFGLVKKESDIDNYFDLPLRYIGFLPHSIIKNVTGKSLSIHNIENIIKKDRIDSLIKDNVTVNKILGYIPKILK